MNRTLCSATALAVALGVAACSGLGTPPAAGVRTVELEGQTYRVEQLTASTWTAAAAAGVPDARQSASLVRAIEKASGCRVTDSSPGQGTVLSAQVDCGSRLKN